MEKEEVIQKGYGIFWDKLSEIQKRSTLKNNGWLSVYSYNSFSEELFLDIRDVFHTDDDFFQSKRELNGNLISYRPKSLHGIEDNNGWIKIEEGSIPQEDVWVCNINGNKIAFLHHALEPYFKSCTHYQEIKKPKPPLH